MWVPVLARAQQYRSPSPSPVFVTDDNVNNVYGFVEKSPVICHTSLVYLFLLLTYTKKKALEITITSWQPAIGSCNVEVFPKMGSSSLI